MLGFSSAELSYLLASFLPITKECNITYIKDSFWVILSSAKRPTRDLCQSPQFCTDTVVLAEWK